jgi:hypothetical protein
LECAGRAATALWIRFSVSSLSQFHQSGVALRLPPHSKLPTFRQAVWQVLAASSSQSRCSAARIPLILPFARNSKGPNSPYISSGDLGKRWRAHLRNSSTVLHSDYRSVDPSSCSGIQGIPSGGSGRPVRCFSVAFPRLQRFYYHAETTMLLIRPPSSVFVIQNFLRCAKHYRPGYLVSMPLSGRTFLLS